MESSSSSPPDSSRLPDIKEHPPSATSGGSSRPKPQSLIHTNVPISLTTTTVTSIISTTTRTTTSTTTVCAANPSSSANTTNILHTPTTPRIDISRASSSSHHDSRDSSPENVFDQVIYIISDITTL